MAESTPTIQELQVRTVAKVGLRELFHSLAKINHYVRQFGDNVQIMGRQAAVSGLHSESALRRRSFSIIASFLVLF